MNKLTILSELSKRIKNIIKESKSNILYVEGDKIYERKHNGDINFIKNIKKIKMNKTIDEFKNIFNKNKMGN